VHERVYAIFLITREKRTPQLRKNFLDKESKKAENDDYGLKGKYARWNEYGKGGVVFDGWF
jgi:hypothetical protein